MSALPELRVLFPRTVEGILESRGTQQEGWVLEWKLQSVEWR
jgi:hypothetical protein